MNRVTHYSDGSPIMIGDLIDRWGAWNTRWGYITDICENLVYASYKGGDVIIYDLDNRGLPV